MTKKTCVVFSFQDYARRCPRPPPYLLTSRRFDKRFSRIAAAMGFAGRLCATPTSRATSSPSRKKRPRRYGFDVYSGEDGVFERVYVDADEGDIRKGS